MISIILPVFQVEPYLDRCVALIVGQTYRDLEIILVDDASPDACPQMCDRWAGRDSRIRVLHVPHGGLSCARNAGLDAARSEFIVFVDSDDTIAPAMCERFLCAQAATGADIVFCDVVRRLPEGDRIAGPFPFPISPSSLIGKAVFLDDFFLFVSQALKARSRLEQTLPPKHL